MPADTRRPTQVRSAPPADVAGHVRGHVYDPARRHDRERRPAVHPARPPGPPGALEWVISGYALSLAALIPVSGALGDRYGRRRVFLAGVVVFAIGSAACALSPNEIVARRVPRAAGGGRRGDAGADAVHHHRDVPARDPGGRHRHLGGRRRDRLRRRPGGGRDPAHLLRLGPRVLGQPPVRGHRDHDHRGRGPPGARPAAPPPRPARRGGQRRWPVRGHPRADRVGLASLALVAGGGAVWSASRPGRASSGGSAAARTR